MKFTKAYSRFQDRVIAYMIVFLYLYIAEKSGVKIQLTEYGKRFYKRMILAEMLTLFVFGILVMIFFLFKH
jgi:hypothetical protein